MDGISGASAVIGLVQAATQVTRALYQYVSSVKSAESSRKELLERIDLITKAAKTIEMVLQDSPCLSREPQLQDHVDSWFQPDSPPSRCKRDLDALSQWLEKEIANSKRNKLAKKLMWPTKEDKIKATIRSFEEYMPYFQFTASIESLSLQKSTTKKNMRNDIEDTKLKLLRWLDGFDCTDKHDNTLEQRQETTGEWLLQEQLYIDWLKCSTKFIWLHGKPGAGKSVLASVVIDSLTGGLSDDEALAYFYCDFRNTRCTSTAEVLRSLAKQLLSKSKGDWLSSFSDLTNLQQQGAGPPTSVGKLLDLLRRAAELHVKPVVVVDALDECEDMQRLLDELLTLSRGHCRLFVTSRTLHAVSEAFAGLPSIPLGDRDDDVRNDMLVHIKAELRLRPRLRIFRQDLKDEIEDALMRKADGIWVQCQLDRLNKCCSRGDVRKTLDTLPDTLYDTYDQMLRAIDKKSSGFSNIARRALVWLVTTRRPLKLSQLTEAVSISPDKPEQDDSTALMHDSVLLDILGSLVAVSSQNYITLSHYSVKEYLTSDVIAHNAYFIDRSSASLELATTSIFSLILFSDEAGATPKGSKDRLRSYAVRDGLRHLVDCPADNDESLVEHLLILQNHVSMRDPLHAYLVEHCGWMPKAPQSALYIIIRFGNSSLLHRYLDRCPVRTAEEDNPLVFALLHYDVSLVQLLLDKGADVNLKGPASDGSGVRRMTPLTAAARNKTSEIQESLVKLLLTNGCVVSKGAIYSILSCELGACCGSAVIRILLEHGADPRWLGAGGKSCLHVALERDFGSSDSLELARMLVSAGCDPTALDDLGHSPFHYAIESRSTASIGWLLQSGFHLPSNAIHHAACHNSRGDVLPVLEFLLANGALAGARDIHGSNALHYVAGVSRRRNHTSVIQLLVEHGCDINCRNDAGETPLHLAIQKPGFGLDILALFLAQGAELPVDIVNYAVCWSNTWVFNAKRTIETITTLRERHGASCQSQTVGEDNALHCLMRGASAKHESVVDVALFLVDNGCDVDAPNSSGETPLQLAVENGCISFAQKALGLIAKPHAVNHTIKYHGDSRGDGILHRLCRRQSGKQLKEKTELLQKAGYDFAKHVNMSNKAGFTPLCIALMYGKAKSSPAIISCLLDLGASFHHVNYLHLESLEWASNHPWYHNAIDAQRCCLSRSKTTPDDVILVHHHLRIAHPGGLSVAVARSILDMAEYWACMKVTRNNVQYASDGRESILFPAVPGGRGCWIPRRVIFAFKPGVPVHSNGRDDASIKLHIERTGSMFSVPVSLRVSPYIEWPYFSVWDEHTPAPQVNGRQKLMVGELVPGETLSIKFDTNNDYFTLKFFQLEVYFSLKPSSD